MEISVSDAKRAFSVTAHFVLLMDGFLQAASFGGLETSVRAVAASIIEGRKVTLIEYNNLRNTYSTEKGNYAKIERKAGDIYHGLVLHKAEVFNEEHPSPIIIAWDGNLDKAIGEYLVARYTLPATWLKEYPKLIPQKAMQPLTVERSRYSRLYRGIKAVRLSNTVNE